MAENQENFDDIEKSKQVEPRSSNNALQTISRVVSILPCLPKRVPTPPTPNIDQVNILNSVVINCSFKKTYFSIKNKYK